MKREDITKQFPDATKEQIDALMAIYGEDINKANAKVKNLEDQLKQAQAEPPAAQGGGGDPELSKQLRELKKEIKDMKDADALRTMREKVAKDSGVPAGCLAGKTEEECAQQAAALKQWKDDAVKEAQANSYPALQDSGEATGAQPTGTSAAWGDLLAGLHPNE